MGPRFDFLRTTARGFSLTELMIVVAFGTTLMAISVPIVSDISRTAKLNEAVRSIERELQSARLRAVNLNRRLRVRLNCPASGYLRTVEVIGTADDSSTNRCLLSAYPYPAADTDLMTKPNYDGPIRTLPPGSTVTSAVFEFEPDGTVYKVVSGTPESIPSSETITITRGEKYKSVTVNGAGKIQLQ
jgi:prepilin-type N-terminal cleavage/methylation domain-containing protein